jgi:DNA-binding beta-propeller fold protein YncE
VWVAAGGASLYVIRESTGRGKTITGVQNNATGVAIDPAARKVLVADEDTGSSVFILSEKTDQITSKIGVGFFPSNPAVDPVTGKAYVPIAFRATVTEFRTHGSAARPWHAGPRRYARPGRLHTTSGA